MNDDGIETFPGGTAAETATAVAARIAGYVPPALRPS